MHDDPQPKSDTPATADAPALRKGSVRRIDSAELFSGAREIVIDTTDASINCALPRTEN